MFISGVLIVSTKVVESSCLINKYLLDVVPCWQYQLNVEATGFQKFLIKIIGVWQVLLLDDCIIHSKITSFSSVTEGLFIWRRVVPGRRVTLSLEPSFVKGIYEKSCPCCPNQNLSFLVQQTGESCFKTSKIGTFSKCCGRPIPFFGRIYRRRRFQIIRHFVSSVCSVSACSVCVNLSLVGEEKITKLLMQKKGWLAPQSHPTFKASDPPPGVTLFPSHFCKFLV